MGDCLLSLGLVCASHFCRLLVVWCASALPSICIPVLGFSPAHSRRSSRSAPSSTSLSVYPPEWVSPSNDLIQLTEIHEYLMGQFDPVKGDAGSDSSPSQQQHHHRPPSSLSLHRNFLAYKLIYAQRLLEAGLSKRALCCCEELANLVRFDTSFGAVLANQIESLATRLLLEDRTFYASYVIRRNSFSKALPLWLANLRTVSSSSRTFLAVAEHWSSDRFILWYFKANYTQNMIFFYQSFWWISFWSRNLRRIFSQQQFFFWSVNDYIPSFGRGFILPENTPLFFHFLSTNAFFFYRF